MTTTYVKIMSKENMGDDNTSKGFTMIPIPEKGYFKFDRVLKFKTGRLNLDEYTVSEGAEDAEDYLMDSFFDEKVPVLLVWNTLTEEMPTAIELTGNAYVVNDRKTIASFAYAKYN